MTTLLAPLPPTRSAGPRRLELAAGWAAAAGTLPYLALKAAWLSGAGVGITDPAALDDTSITVLNAITVGLDLAVIALALSLTYGWARRRPAWLLLLPMWIGIGLLAPIAISLLPTAMLTAGAAPEVGGPLEPWVQPLVYGGFAWQGTFLVTAFVLHARRRWAGVVAVPAVEARPFAGLLRVLATGGATMAGLSALLRLADGIAAGTATTVTVAIVQALLAIVGAAGVLALVRRTATHRWLATAAAFVGSGAMFAWGLWVAGNVLGATALGGAAPLSGLAGLTGLLGGLTLAIGGLLALLGAGVAQPVR